MSSRRVLPFALAVSAALPAAGQTTPLSSDDAIAGLGVKKRFQMSSTTVINALRCHLCTQGHEVIDEQGSDQNGYHLECDSDKPTFIATIVEASKFWKPEKDEKATPWAKVTVEVGGASPSTLVTIGAKLMSKDERLKRARGHYFESEASPWARRVWRDLGRWSSPGAKRCSGS